MCVIMISFSQSGFMDQRCIETPQFMTNEMDIRGLQSAEGHCCLQYSQLYSDSFKITNWMDNLPPSCVHIQCWRTDLHQRQPIWLHRVACLAHNNAQMTMWEHQIIMLQMDLAKTFNSGNPRINFLHHQVIVSCPRRHHFQALPSSTTLPHSTWHQVHNQALVVQPKDIRVMGHRGKETTSPKEDILDLKCFRLTNLQDRGRHLQAHLKCLQHWLGTFQSISRHLPALLHTDIFAAHLGEIPLASKRNDFGQLRNRAGQMLQGLLICPNYQIFLMMNSMQMLRAMMRRAWARPNAKPQSAWSKPNSPWSNLPKRWGSPTSVRSTSGRRYGSLGFWRRNIGPLSQDSIVWTRCKMAPCTGR